MILQQFLRIEVAICAISWLFNQAYLRLYVSILFCLLPDTITVPLRAET